MNQSEKLDQIAPALVAAQEKLRHPGQFQPKRICVRGHDTEVVGRETRSRRCVACRDEDRQTPEYKEANRRRARDWHHANRKRYRHNQLLKRYNLTPQEYESLLDAQGRCCAICGATEAGGRGEWHVDHHHGTGEVRGLLCHRCNPALGLFREDRLILLRAVSYLTSGRDLFR